MKCLKHSLNILLWLEFMCTHLPDIWQLYNCGTSKDQAARLKIRAEYRKEYDGTINARAIPMEGGSIINASL